MSKLRIESDGRIANTRVFVDDTDISGVVRAVKWDHTVGEIPTAELEIVLPALCAQEVRDVFLKVVPVIAHPKVQAAVDALNEVLAENYSNFKAVTADFRCTA